ncbi:steroid 3-ketoacyl-CoA thiolase [Streptomyces sp. MUM 203J]|uniref:steroid 3-ketoacyl-CoA thiolase n=1 Tax=Streptomyces sp. MUM 203J TaxID=2791990 RepID=UPI001F04AA6C|nr:steroid 3-ketoacyl-CoA thiolase [Streptomyces sp. MUM 203J]MCH0539025.1 steroid 3-ketoacyl-CoA thiolase [Streptomyces sp. MUM 203J]
MPAEPVIVEAVRTPLGLRGGALAPLHPAHLLGETCRELLGRGGIPADCVEQVVGGTAVQTGEQAANPARTAWLAAGLPYETAATTVDFQGGSSQQAAHLVAGLIAAGIIDVGVSCGAESASRVPPGGDGHGRALPDDWHIDLPHPVRAAERIARHRGIGRDRADAYALLSQRRAAAAWAEERFKRETFPVQVPAPDDLWRLVDRDEGPRDGDGQTLAGLTPLTPDAVHTTGTRAPAADGAAALLWASKRMARALGLRPRARVLAQAAVGADPRHHLDGAVDATRAVLGRAGMSVRDLDLFEVDECFAGVVLSWTDVFGRDERDGLLERVNVNGGALALGHPGGAAGARLLTTVLHELERRDAATALVTMSAGGALATATILQRL